MVTESSDRNALKPEQAVVSFDGAWGCPECHEMNSAERNDCESCGQRVSVATETEEDDGDEAVERGVMSVDQWLETSPKAAADDGVEEAASAAEAAQLGKSLLDWTCPFCRETVRLKQRPKLRPSNISIALFVAAGVAGVAGGMLFGLIGMIVGATVMTILALIPPMVVVVKCPRCGRTATKRQQ